MHSLLFALTIALCAACAASQPQGPVGIGDSPQAGLGRPAPGVAPLPQPDSRPGAGGAPAAGGAGGAAAAGGGAGAGAVPPGSEAFSLPEGAPFTFDGFPFGYGGVAPVDRGIDGFTSVIYDAVFRRVLNSGLGVYLGAGIPNNINATAFLPPRLQEAVTRTVLTPFGLDPAGDFVSQFLTPAFADAGARVPSGCVAPIYSLEVNGGACDVEEDGSVTCEPPFVSLVVTPLTCRLEYASSPSLSGQSLRYSRAFGEARSGYVGPPPGVYDFGATYNLTRLYLGFNAATRRVLNDYGASQWYGFLANFVTANVLRARDGIKSLSVFPEPPPISGQWPLLGPGGAAAGSGTGDSTGSSDSSGASVGDADSSAGGGQAGGGGSGGREEGGVAGSVSTDEEEVEDGLVAPFALSAVPSGSPESSNSHGNQRP